MKSQSKILLAIFELETITFYLSFVGLLVEKTMLTLKIHCIR